MQHFSLILLFVCSVWWLHGQSYENDRRQLEIEKKRLLDEIKKNEAELSKTNDQKKDVLSNLSRIEQNILHRKLLISSIIKEQRLIDNQVARQTQEKKKLETQKLNLQREFSTTLRWVYRNKINNNVLHFLISAESFNDAFRRMQLLRQYQRYRSQQADALKNTLLEISKNLNFLQSLRSEKNLLVQNLQKQEKDLSAELIEKTKLMAGLESTEKKLLQTIALQEAQRANLQNAIQNAIQKEIEAAQRKKIPLEAPNYLSTFANRKGNLDWPVNHGKVTQAFGKRPHPTLKKILIQNNGINISTPSDALVLAVHQGIVVGVTEVPGYNFSVIIKHENDYFTVYTNLAVVSVAKGEKVSLHQKLGRVPSGNPEFHFEIWNLKEHLDPLAWLQNKSPI